MDALHYKVGRLRSLWQEFRNTNDGVDGCDYGDQSEWARGKLQNILTEFDKLIQEQVIWKSALFADIQDLLVEIEDYCILFGRNIDTIIPHVASMSYELSYNTRDKLFSIRNSLKEEATTTQNDVKTWVKHLSVFVKELNSEYQVPPIELFDSDLSSSVVLPVRHKYDEMVRIVAPLRESFEECAIQLHHYWNMLHYTPQDEIDKGMICLFANKSSPKELFETLQETIKNRENNLKNKNNNNDKEGNDDEESDDLVDPQLTRQIQEFMNQEFHYYQLNLPTGLNLSCDQLEILKGKVKSFEKDYQVRKGKLDMLSKGVKYLYGELKTPVEERIQICDDNLDEEYLEKLNLEFERLREIMRAIIQKAIEEFTAQLVDLWDKCLVPQYERDEFFESLQKIESADEVYELLSQEVSRLQELYAKCAKIYRWMLERRALIEKMIEFEKKASDPRRLFQSSFRLLEEEKWRKSCWPNLVKIEDKLINACVAYEETERKPFMHESKRYLDTLQGEISERIVNQMFFGFEKDSVKAPKSPKSKEKDTTNNSLSTRRQGSSSSSSSNGSIRVAMSRPVSPAHSVNGDSSSTPTINVNGRERDGSNGNSNGVRGRPMSLYVPNSHHSPNSRRNSTATRLSPASSSSGNSISRPVSPSTFSRKSGGGSNGGSGPNKTPSSRSTSRAPSRAPSRTPSRAPSRAVSPSRNGNHSINGLGVSPVLLSTKLKNRRHSAYITSPIEVTSSASPR
ncbi:hypothetical protein Glove_117g41 [Diversispora epigaea]|uniref:Microtubule associated protein n=1 Tax=Diversispora epigaea TaxID=1348612 RepID=A0A397J326_9GLOM|nr:hypothetical protein Glove_117g41 [Diversispora epigaea]